MKKRIIPIILYDGKTVIKGKNFSNDRTIGSVEAVANLYSRRRPDEIAFLDVTATHEKRSPNFEIFRYLIKKILLFKLEIHPYFGKTHIPPAFTLPTTLISHANFKHIRRNS